MNETPVDQESGGTTDGRRRRSERSKHRIASAMIDLIMEGDLNPSAEAIAERAGVGLRSVFRHFKDMDNLFLEVSKVFRSINEELFTHTVIGDTWQEKIDDIARYRAKLFDGVLPMLQSTELHKHRSKFALGDYLSTNQSLRRALLETLPKDLRRNSELVEGLDAVLSSAFWIRLRIDQGLSPAKARKVVKAQVDLILKGQQ